MIRWARALTRRGLAVLGTPFVKGRCAVALTRLPRGLAVHLVLGQRLGGLGVVLPPWPAWAAVITTDETTYRRWGPLLFGGRCLPKPIVLTA